MLGGRTVAAAADVAVAVADCHSAILCPAESYNVCAES